MGGIADQAALRALQRHVREFCPQTSIHGIGPAATLDGPAGPNPVIWSS